MPRRKAKPDKIDLFLPQDYEILIQTRIDNYLLSQSKTYDWRSFYEKNKIEILLFIHIINSQYDTKNYIWVLSEDESDYLHVYNKQFPIDHRRLSGIKDFLMLFDIVRVKFNDGVFHDKVTHKEFHYPDYYYQLQGEFKSFRLIENIEVPRKYVARIRKSNMYQSVYTKSKLADEDNKQYKKEYQLLKNLKFNVKQARSYIQTLPAGNYREIVLYQAKAIQTNKFRISISENCGRLFSTANNLKSDLRKFIKDENDRSLVYLDIKSCNPTLIYTLLKSNDLIILTEKEKEDFKTELFRYKNSLEAGTFYEDLIFLLKQNFHKKCSRDLMKTWVMKYWLNCYPNIKIQGERNFFLTIYPTITKIIDSWKFKDGTSSVTKTTLSDYANNIMRIESHLIHDLIIKKFMLDMKAKKDNTYVLYAIHDGIMIDFDHYNDLLEIMQSELNKLTGLKAGINVTDLNYNN